MLNVLILSAVKLSVECRYAECYSESGNAKCPYAECR